MRQYLLGFFIAALVVCEAQPPSLNPPPIRGTLNQILETLNHYSSSPETKPALDGIRKSSKWLAGRLVDEKIPAAYGRSMAQELALLQDNEDSSPEQQAQTLKTVFEDIKLKHSDCKQFGMGRLVKVEVRTVKDGRQEGGWEVFYRWLPSRPLGAVLPQPFLSLSSPTSVEIPPGEYSVQAKKTVGGKEITTPELPVPVAGKKTVTLDIPVL